MIEFTSVTSFCGHKLTNYVMWLTMIEQT